MYLPLACLWSPETTLDSFCALDIPGLTLLIFSAWKSAYKKPYRIYSNKAISCILTDFTLAFIINLQMSASVLSRSGIPIKSLGFADPKQTLIIKGRACRLALFLSLQKILSLCTKPVNAFLSVCTTSCGIILHKASQNRFTGKLERLVTQRLALRFYSCPAKHSHIPLACVRRSARAYTNFW